MDPKKLICTVKHGGGSVMVWGSVAASGVGNLIFIEGNVDRYQYKAILEQNLKPSVDKLNLGGSWIFHVFKRVGDSETSNMLKEKLKEEWQGITSTELENLVASMPRRLQAVLDGRGGPTKY